MVEMIHVKIAMIKVFTNIFGKFKILVALELVLSGLLDVRIFKRLASFCELGVDGIFHCVLLYLVVFAPEKFFGELAHLNVVSAQPGKVFYKYRRDVSGLDCSDHFLKAGALHGSAGNTVIHEKDSVRVALVLSGLLKYLLLVLDAVGLAVHIIITAQSAVESGCAGRDFLA
mgnify:CR=1 FL=1